jgi:hypothetical protein
MLFAAVVRAILSAPSAIDYDIRDALDALVRTYKTLQSGLVYETRPQNPIAAGIYDAVTAGIEESRKQIAATGGTSLRDADIMTVLLIFQREEYRWNNGRQRGRAYVDHLRELFQGMESLPEPAAASLIV